MKKIMCSRLFAFILGAILFSSITVYASYQYTADKISYKNTTTVEAALNDLYNNSSRASSIINNFSITSGTMVGKVVGNTFFQVTPISIDGTISTADSSDVIGYIIVVNGANIAVTPTLPYNVELEPGQQYTIKVLAIDKDNHFKESSNTLTLTTPNLVAMPLDYPVMTSTGMKNVKYVDPTDNTKFTYGLDLNVDCTASDALDKKAYDGDESTYVEPSSGKKYFYFGGDIDIYYVSYKTNATSGAYVYDVNGGYIAVSGESAEYNGYRHCVYYGKGSTAWKNAKSQIGVRIYEFKYDTTIP